MKVKSSIDQQELGSWSIKKSELNNKPIFVRIKVDIKQIDRTRYPYQIGVAVPLISPTDEGLVTESESQILFEIEDQLEIALSKLDVLHVATVTHNSMREFVFYAKKWEPESFEKQVLDIESKLTTSHELQFMMQEDIDWKTYHSFI